MYHETGLTKKDYIGKTVFTGTMSRLEQQGHGKPLQRSTHIYIPDTLPFLPSGPKSGPEKRIARNGEKYTWEEFVEYYGRTAAKEWKKARRRTFLVQAGNCCMGVLRLFLCFGPLAVIIYVIIRAGIPA